ncbi:uncharacterized protein N7483_012712 [Penicillium malachiteum]|uniref:uncharacterized protein n=1 Tax=Penicillium malachiteum TaxID=1324776 RepID=UPI0025497B3A|nr:uncharacterized protein N7483_012712 [Penicillium malachiteum]KAJ5715531.1 hypothetical protein N7483_012712 [Penicillium malachiteum]
MVSRWDGYGTNAANGATMIVDYSYAMFDCLEFAIQPQQVIMNGVDVTAYAYRNTENYVYFALAWWYYNSRMDWQGTTPATFYAGFLQPWTDF